MTHYIDFEFRAGWSWSCNYIDLGRVNEAHFCHPHNHDFLSLWYPSNPLNQEFRCPLKHNFLALKVFHLMQINIQLLWTYWGLYYLKLYFSACCWDFCMCLCWISWFASSLITLSISLPSLAHFIATKRQQTEHKQSDEISILHYFEYILSTEYCWAKIYNCAG